MKIGIVSQSYYPRFGGVTEHVHHTAEELRRRGHDVRIITSRFRSNANDPEWIERVGYNVLIPFNRAFVDFTVGLRLKHYLRELFARHEFDVVHTHCPLAPSLPILAIQSATCPQVGTSSPPRMFRSVDLPDPDGPSKTTNSPGNKSKSTFRSASTDTSPIS